MEENKGLSLTGKDQPIKSVAKQDTYDLKDYLEQLSSWKDPLKLVNKFFENQAIPLNKKEIMRESHAQARVFNIFYMNFVLSMDTLEEKITKLEEKEKIKVQKNQYGSTDFLEKLAFHKEPILWYIAYFR